MQDKPVLYTTPQEAEPRLTDDEFDTLTREPTDDDLYNRAQYVPDSRDENHWTL